SSTALVRRPGVTPRWAEIRTGAFAVPYESYPSIRWHSSKKRRLPIIGVKACSNFPDPIWSYRMPRRSIRQVDVVVVTDAQQLAATRPHSLARLEDVGHLEGDGILARLVFGDTGIVVEQRDGGDDPHRSVAVAHRAR